MMKENLVSKKNRDYLLNFYKRHSIIALCCALLTLILSFYGINTGVIKTIEVWKENGFHAFIYFTMIANVLAALSISFVIPYAVDGIQKKRFVIPKWVAKMHFASVTSLSIMMLFVLLFISWASPYEAFGNHNLVLHIFCPILILISFFQIENVYKYSLKDCFIGCVPFYIYAIVYTIEVVFIGEENGGWPDLYRIKNYISPIISIPILILFGFIVSKVIATISNYITKKREEKVFLNFGKEMDPIEAKIEAYGLGCVMGQQKNENSILVPLDILKQIANKSQIEIGDLVKSYVAGIINTHNLR